MRVLYALMLAAVLVCGVAQPGSKGAFAAPRSGGAKESAYVWTRVTARAIAPGAANVPVFVQGRAYALHADRIWSTVDGRSWKGEPMPADVENGAIQYVQHNGAIYALGALKGGYTDVTIDPVVRRTRDFRKWDTLGRGNLPNRMLYTAISFQGAIWLLGGDDGSHLYNDVWRSVDGLHWSRVTSQAPWAPRSGAKAFVYKDRLWLIGGADATGMTNDVWFTPDGKEWIQVTAEISPQKPFGYTPVVYDNKIWLIGVDTAVPSRSGLIMVSEDGAHWRTIEAPWSARSGVAAWVADDALFMASGALAGAQGDIVYSREVWRMDH